jgi:peptidoglycan/xylan/chitin deacetylase (PgdA/CDA1 family)
MRSGSEQILRKFGSEPNFGRVYLTFDDGPDSDWTPRVLDILDGAGAKATFFVIGRAAQAAPRLVRRIAADGHEIGNHTYGHCHPWTMREAEARDEVRDGAAAIADALGRAPRWFRPPHGRMRRCMLDEAERSGQRTVLWSLSAIDWGPLGHAAGIAARVRGVGPGDIVLMHDGRNHHNRPDELLQVLPQLLAELNERRLSSTALTA